MTKNYVCLTPYLRNCTSDDCGFWYTCVKWWYLQHFVFSFFIFYFIYFFIFSKFWFFGFLGGRVKGQKIDPWLPISVCHTLDVKNCRSYHEEFWYTSIKNDIWRCFSLILFFFIFFYVNIKILTFFIGPL